MVVANSKKVGTNAKNLFKKCNDWKTTHDTRESTTPKGVKGKPRYFHLESQNHVRISPDHDTY